MAEFAKEVIVDFIKMSINDKFWFIMALLFNPVSSFFILIASLIVMEYCL